MSTPVMTDDQPQAEAPRADAERPNSERFASTAWVHCGPGADTCEHGSDGACKDEEHFHAWVTLPNPFQVRDINEKAKAARARRERMLRNPESDAYVILEAELDELRDAAESGALEILVDELIDRDFSSDFSTAMRRVQEQDDPNYTPSGEEGEEIPKLFANIEQDREEYLRQKALPEDERAEDFEELERTFMAWDEATTAELESITEPRKKELMERPLDDLIDMVRRIRIDAQGNEAYLHAYNSWQWFVCTLKPTQKGKGRERVWRDYNTFRQESTSEQVTALRTIFDRLESGLATGGRAAGNS